MTVHSFQSRSDRLWLEFIEAQAKAKSTLDLNDARAAGRAWREFLEEFLPPEDFVKTIQQRDARRTVAK